jgi:hypothetical protein
MHFQGNGMELPLEDCGAVSLIPGEIEASHDLFS